MPLRVRSSPMRSSRCRRGESAWLQAPCRCSRVARKSSRRCAALGWRCRSLSVARRRPNRCHAAGTGRQRSQHRADGGEAARETQRFAVETRNARSVRARCSIFNRALIVLIACARVSHYSCHHCALRVATVMPTRRRAHHRPMLCRLQPNQSPTERCCRRGRAAPTAPLVARRVHQESW